METPVIRSGDWEGCALTAVALVGNGEVTVQKPSEGHAYLYFTGQKMIFISMWRISLKATASCC